MGQAVTTITGSVGQVRDSRTVGDTIAGSFSVATSEYDSQAKADATTWWNVNVIGKDAKYVYGQNNAPALATGDVVVVSGTASLRKYTKRDGTADASCELRAFNNSVQIVKRKNATGDNNGSSDAPTPINRASRVRAATTAAPDDDEGLPF